MLSALALMSAVKYFCPETEVVIPNVKRMNVSRFIVVLQLLVTVCGFKKLAISKHKTVCQH
jgi:hypothetical protein